MICPDCDGKGTISRPYIPSLDLYTINPCETCGGCGISHCCDGDTMPEAPTDHEKDRPLRRCAEGAVILPGMIRDARKKR